MIASKGKLKGRWLLEALLLFTGHNGLLRIGELLCGIQVSDVIWDSDLLGFQIFLERTKTGRSGPGVYVAFRDHGTISAVSLMRDWFDDNDLWSCHTSHVFSLLVVTSSILQKQCLKIIFGKLLRLGHYLLALTLLNIRGIQ